MKKLTVFILTIFTVATLFAAARPSLDGRAVVAENGTMPRGLFARTVGYLPGDSVTVTNPATGSTCDVLVLGAIDPSEGVAILLSPEAADALKISPDSNVQVKLTKRSGSLDENAVGSAVLSDDEEDAAEAPLEEAPVEVVAEAPAAETPSDTAESAAEVPVETEVAAENAAPAEDAPVPGEELIASASENEAGDNETEVFEDPLAFDFEYEDEADEEVAEAEESPVEAEAAVETEVVEAVPEVKAPVEEIPVVEEKAYEAVALAPAETAPVTEPKKTVKQLQPVILVQEEEKEEQVEVEMLPAVEEELPALVKDKEEKEALQPVVIVETEAVSEAEDEAESYVEEVVEAENAPAEAVEETVAAAETVAPVEEAVTEEQAVTAEAVEEAPAFEVEPEVVVEAPVEAVTEEKAVEQSAEEAYQPIVLVPAELNPPEPVAKTAPVAEKAPEPVKEAAPAVPVKEETKAKIAVSNDWTNYIVPSHSNLRSGSYYIQIASLGNVDNIKNIIKKYSSKYPMVLVQSTNGKTYQVMVGPLNIDEYGSVLAKFKAYGYKDAFVKKIK